MLPSVRKADTHDLRCEVNSVFVTVEHYRMSQGAIGLDRLAIADPCSNAVAKLRARFNLAWRHIKNAID